MCGKREKKNEANTYFYINPIALRKSKIVYNFGLPECKGLSKKGNLQNF